LDWRLFGWLDARTETREADSPVSVGFSGECRRSAFKGGCDFMTRNYQSVVEPQLAMPGNLHELVRGQEQRLLKELEPVVRQHSVTLDMRQIERIDAAGISLLISLYGAAHAAGHEFAIMNASARVAEILEIVGLDRILISPESATGIVPCPEGAPCYEMPAA
jgi:anti-anti-sigma factor